MLEFFLFRIKLEFPEQISLFNNLDVIDKPSLIRSAISEKPSAEIRKDHWWHIGNVEKLGQNGLFFFLGKETKSSTSIYDTDEGNFKEGSLEEAPYTQVFIDTTIQLCAIGKKNKISPKTQNIATNLANLLNKSATSREGNFSFIISQINNPENFLKSIENADAVKKFSFSLSRPNPFDANRDFHEPLKKLTREINSKKGKAEFVGENLSKEVITDLAKSVSTSGDDATAKLIPKIGGPAIAVRLGNNPARLHAKDDELKGKKEEFLSEIQNLYFKIRGDQELKP